MKHINRITPLLAGILLSGCGIDTGGGDTAVGGLDAAWQMFRNGQYPTAREAFQELSLEGELYPEATQGIAWCYLMLNEPDLAVPAFRQALQADPEQTAALAGEAFSLRDTSLPDYNRLISRARLALQRDPDFSFSQRSSINWLDLHVLMGQAFFYQQSFDSTLVHLLEVDPSIPLSAADSLSWQDYPSFPSALLDELLRLGELTSD